MKGFFVRGQILEDYCLEILIKTPGLYQILKIKIEILLLHSALKGRL